MAIANNLGVCWICGDVATTGEHSHKKSDVVAMFGKKFSKKVIKTDLEGNDKTFVQGPDSKELKYRNNLCAKCNNEKTQLYDSAYKVFAEYVRENNALITRESEINMNLVFGKHESKKKKTHLFRYFAKAFGCQMHDAGLPIPQILKDILAGKNYSSIYKVCICLNYRKLEGLSSFPLEGDTNASGGPVDFYWAQDNGWFTVVHAYSRQIPSQYGKEWLGKSKMLVVGKWEDIP